MIIFYFIICYFTIAMLSSYLFYYLAYWRNDPFHMRLGNLAGFLALVWPFAYFGIIIILFTYIVDSIIIFNIFNPIKVIKYFAGPPKHEV